MNSPDGWRHLLDWLITQKVQRVHACLGSTGRYSLGSRAHYTRLVMSSASSIPPRFGTSRDQVGSQQI